MFKKIRAIVNHINEKCKIFYNLNFHTCPLTKVHFLQRQNLLPCVQPKQTNKVWDESVCYFKQSKVHIQLHSLLQKEEEVVDDSDLLKTTRIILC